MYSWHPTVPSLHFSQSNLCKNIHWIMSIPILALFSGFSMPWRKGQNLQQGPQPSLFSLLFLLPAGHQPCHLLLVCAVLCVLPRWCLEHAGPLSEALSTYTYPFIISWLTSDKLLHLGSDIKQAFPCCPHLTRSSSTCSHTESTFPSAA